MTELERIDKAIVIDLSIKCSKCNKISGGWCYNEYNFSEDLLELGWRATVKNIYCPECAKKYLKNEKRTKKDF